ncbi:unnamed protein product [Cylicostephanus goldi]|uniref:Uncharacterized protein n=1 Tax=Cylicostephanus goldi TaxID=71465 RepID=A0A3P7LRC2_CYLGO|nr:unnamed protein product [Cylicostephanus goldi]
MAELTSQRISCSHLRFQDVPQDSWVKSTNVIGSGHVAGGPNPISRTFDRFPTIGGRPPLGNEFSRDMRRF